MISINRYLRIVKQQSLKAGVRDEECHEWLKAYLPDEEKMEKIKTSMKAFTLDPKNGRTGLMLVVPLSDFRTKIYDRSCLERYSEEWFDLDNWLYDRQTGYVLVNMDIGSHEAVSALLAQAYHPDLKRGYLGMKEIAECSEEFIVRGCGWKCSAGTYGRILKSKEVKLTAQEKMSFKNYTLYDL